MLKIRAHLALWLTTSLFIILLAPLVWGQRTESADWAADIANRYRIVPNTIYLTANIQDTLPVFAFQWFRLSSADKSLF
jgi:hypothetical protein